jgi:predicted ArsR family transcriptional regulator
VEFTGHPAGHPGGHSEGHPEGSLASDQPTRERVVRSILVNGPSTAADLAERLELTPAAVRRHLDHLLSEGTLEARDPRPTASRGRGRPAKVFAITDAGRDHFDQQYDDLAVQALHYLAETGGDEAVLEFARRRVEFIERDYAAVTAADPGLSPAEAMARVFSSEGYAASVRSLPLLDGLAAAEQLCQQHCPVSHVASQFPQLCEAETEAIGRVLGRHVQRLATIAHGDGVCTTCIPHVSVVEEVAQRPSRDRATQRPWVSTSSTDDRRPLVSTSSTDEEAR